MINFFKNYGVSKTEKIGDKIMEYVATCDPHGATEAEIKTMEEELDKMSIEAVEARNSFLKEKKEYEIINANYSKMLSVAEKLQDKISAETDAEKKASLETSLSKLVSDLEKMHVDIEREHTEAVDAEGFLDSLNESVKMLAERLKTSRKDYADAIRDMKHSALVEEKAKAQEEITKRLAGITKATSGGHAINAIRKAAEDSRNRAEAAKTRSELLKPSFEPVVSDIMNELTPKVETKSLSERLNDLKK
jgi:DNA-binding ferritin-like protein